MLKFLDNSCGFGTIGLSDEDFSLAGLPRVFFGSAGCLVVTGFFGARLGFVTAAWSMRIFISLGAEFSSATKLVSLTSEASDD